jgi:hypothetical protein
MLLMQAHGMRHSYCTWPSSSHITAQVSMIKIVALQRDDVQTYCYPNYNSRVLMSIHTLYITTHLSTN